MSRSIVPRRDLHWTDLLQGLILGALAGAVMFGARSRHHEEWITGAFLGAFVGMLPPCMRYLFLLGSAMVNETVEDALRAGMGGCAVGLILGFVSPFLEGCPADLSFGYALCWAGALGIVCCGLTGLMKVFAEMHEEAP